MEATASVRVTGLNPDTSTVSITNPGLRWECSSQGTPLPPPITTISFAERLARIGRSIGTVDENLWFFKAAFVIGLNILITFCMVRYMVSRVDGMERIGWMEQKTQMNNVDRLIYSPVYIKSNDFKEVQEGK